MEVLTKYRLYSHPLTVQTVEVEVNTFLEKPKIVNEEVMKFLEGNQ